MHLPHVTSAALGCAAMLAACGGDAGAGNANGEASTLSEDSETAMGDAAAAAGWANQIAVVCEGEAGPGSDERCGCVAERLTAGRTPAEIAALSDADRQAAWESCG